MHKESSPQPAAGSPPPTCTAPSAIFKQLCSTSSSSHWNLDRLASPPSDSSRQPDRSSTLRVEGLQARSAASMAASGMNDRERASPCRVSGRYHAGSRVEGSQMTTELIQIHRTERLMSIEAYPTAP